MDALAGSGSASNAFWSDACSWSTGPGAGQGQAAPRVALGADELALVELISLDQVQGLPGTAEITAQLAHRAGLLADDDLEAMLSALEKLRGDVESGVFVPAQDDEDVHTALERGLIERAGADVGGRLRAGHRHHQRKHCAEDDGGTSNGVCSSHIDL